MSDVFQVFMPISKIDKDKRTVSGYASTPSIDSDGERVSLAAIKAALPEYMEYGNIREMHQLKAVGVAEEAHVDDVGLFLTAKIVGDDAWAKCVAGVYKGFSIGGKKTAKRGNTITGINMTEISVVDRPANPDCKFNVAKSVKDVDADGVDGFLLKSGTKDPRDKALRKMAKAVSALTKSGPPAAHDGFSLPAKTEKSEACAKHGTVGCAKCAAKAAKASAKASAKAESSVPDPSEAEVGKAKEGLCKAHGVAGCTKCAVAKEGGEDAEMAAKKKTAKAIGWSEEDENRFGLSPVSDLGKAAGATKEPDFLNLHKSMRTASSMSYAFDSLRDVQRSLLMEAKREGGDKKDKSLADKVGKITKDLADVIGQKALHEGAEALTLTDADDSYLSSLLGEDKMAAINANDFDFGGGDPIAKALGLLMKRAAEPTRLSRMEAAKGEMKKARDMMKAAREVIEEVHKMHKAAYLSKMQKAAKAKKKTDDEEDDDKEFDHAGAMEKMQKAYSAIGTAATMNKAAGGMLKKAMASRSGQRGQEANDPEAGVFEVPPGVKDLSPRDLATAGPGGRQRGSEPPMYPVDGSVYAGKAAGGDDLRKFVKNGQVSVEVMELLLNQAAQEAELSTLRKMRTGGGGRPHMFDTRTITQDGKMLRGPAGSTLQKAMFEGVNVGDIGCGDEELHKAASARAIGNMLQSGHFGKSVMDPTFHGVMANTAA